MWKKIFLIIAIFGFVALFAVFLRYYNQLGVATGYAAKKICNCTYVTGRDQAEVEQNDLYFTILPYVKSKTNDVRHSATSTLFGLYPQTSIFKPGIGCVLLQGEDDYRVKFPMIPEKSRTQDDFDQVMLTNGVQIDALSKIVENLFDKNGRLDTKQTTALLVFHRDTLIVEAYAPPFTRHTAQLGWSMTKSWMNTFAGLMVMDDKIKLKDYALFADWQNDGRNAISIKHLLNMESGLYWEEDYTTVSDATRMLYFSEDVSEIAIEKPLQYKPGTHWSYSSGTTNILSRYFRNVFRDDSTYMTYLKTRFFDVLDMSSAFIETDESGTFIGSSYGYATPLDWGKFGLLYLHDGVWNGDRILPEGWVDFTKTEVPSSDGKYGAQFWLNQRGSQFPDAPYDMYMADGFLGQFVFIIPSHDVVIVRMGTGKGGFDVNTFIKEALATIPRAMSK